MISLEPDASRFLKGQSSLFQQIFIFIVEIFNISNSINDMIIIGIFRRGISLIVEEGKKN